MEQSVSSMPWNRESKQTVRHHWMLGPPLISWVFCSVLPWSEELQITYRNHSNWNTIPSWKRTASICPWHCQRVPRRHSNGTSRQKHPGWRRPTTGRSTFCIRGCSQTPGSIVQGGRYQEVDEPRILSRAGHTGTKESRRKCGQSYCIIAWEVIWKQIE